jgi:hypothetical protein
MVTKFASEYVFLIFKRLPVIKGVNNDADNLLLRRTEIQELPAQSADTTAYTFCIWLICAKALKVLNKDVMLISLFLFFAFGVHCVIRDDYFSLKKNWLNMINKMVLGKSLAGTAL